MCRYRSVSKFHIGCLNYIIQTLIKVNLQAPALLFSFLQKVIKGIKGIKGIKKKNFSLSNILLNMSFGQTLFTAILYIEHTLLLPHATFIIMHFKVYLGNQVLTIILYIIEFMTID